MSAQVTTVRTTVSTVHHWPSGDELIVREHVTDTKENLVRRWRSNGRPFRETADGGLQYEDQHAAPGDRVDEHDDADVAAMTPAEVSAYQERLRALRAERERLLGR